MGEAHERMKRVFFVFVYGIGTSHSPADFFLRSTHTLYRHYSASSQADDGLLTLGTPWVHLGYTLATPWVEYEMSEAKV